MASPLPHDLRASAKQAARDYLHCAYPTKKRPTIRSAAKDAGVSRAAFHKLIQEVRREQLFVASSPLRKMFGDAPLRIGLGLKMLDPSWRRRMGGAA